MSTAKIMIVEDESIVIKDIKRSLEHMGYAVCAQATSGEEALEKVAESEPDLILLDIILSGELDGIETAEQPCWLASVHCLTVAAIPLAATPVPDRPVGHAFASADVLIRLSRLVPFVEASTLGRCGLSGHGISLPQCHLQEGCLGSRLWSTSGPSKG